MRTQTVVLILLLSFVGVATTVAAEKKPKKIEFYNKPQPSKTKYEKSPYQGRENDHRQRYVVAKKVKIEKAPKKKSKRRGTWPDWP